MGTKQKAMRKSASYKVFKTAVEYRLQRGAQPYYSFQAA